MDPDIGIDRDEARWGSLKGTEGEEERESGRVDDKDEEKNDDDNENDEKDQFLIVK